MRHGVFSEENAMQFLLVECSVVRAVHFLAHPDRKNMKQLLLVVLSWPPSEPKSFLVQVAALKAHEDEVLCRVLLGVVRIKLNARACGETR